MKLRTNPRLTPLKKKLRKSLLRTKVSSEEAEAVEVEEAAGAVEDQTQLKTSSEMISDNIRRREMANIIQTPAVEIVRTI